MVIGADRVLPCLFFWRKFFAALRAMGGDISIVYYVFAGWTYIVQRVSEYNYNSKSNSEDQYYCRNMQVICENKKHERNGGDER